MNRPWDTHTFANMLALKKCQNFKTWEALLKVTLLKILVNNSMVIHWLLKHFIKIYAGGFSVAFDPLDGSSIVDTNFSVGTIFGVWPGDKLTGVKGSDQVAAAMGVYGPRTTYVLALKDFPGTHEFLLLDEGYYLQLNWIKSCSLIERMAGSYQFKTLICLLYRGWLVRQMATC